MQTADPAASSSDTLVDSAVTVYPIHLTTMKRSGLKYTSLSSTPTVNGCDLTPPTRTQTEQEYSDLTTSNRPPLTPYFRKTAQSFSQGTGRMLFRGRQNKRKTSRAHFKDFTKISWE